MSGVKGRSGRRPLPTELKKQRGTFRDDQGTAEVEVSFPVSELTAPEWVAEDELANDEWNRVVPLLSSVRILTDPDLTALANYCLLTSMAIRAARAVNSEGLMVDTSVGGLKANPHIKIAQDARAQCLRYAIEFGLTPAARSRIAGHKKETLEDPAEEFLFHPPKLVVP